MLITRGVESARAQGGRLVHAVVATSPFVPADTRALPLVAVPSAVLHVHLIALLKGGGATRGDNC
ncbi:hypothetical protein EB73_04735 [Mycobacterium sp. SWH-M3]|nr:hypothetical protein EB73_04735 [Mycobacterium sp. SWH-M3]